MEQTKPLEEEIMEAEAEEKEAAAEEKTGNETAAEEKTEKETAADDTQKKLDELNDKYLRTLAEYDNFRKRSQREKESIAVDSKVLLLGKLLPVFDNLGRCLANADSDAETLRKGLEMTVKQLSDIFAKLGVTVYGEPGDEFDPNIHNAVMHTEDENLPENSVTDVFEKGYRLGDTVIRPATVKVVN